MTHQYESEIGRASFREEGIYWKAYYSLKDSMDDGILISSIPMRLVRRSKERRAQFMDLVIDCIADVIEDITGSRPTVRAPEHEKAGHC